MARLGFVTPKKVAGIELLHPIGNGLLYVK